MELRIISYVYIETERIIEDYKLKQNSPKDTIVRAIQDYVAELDDCDYCLIGNVEIEKIYKEICTLLGKNSQ